MPVLTCVFFLQKVLRPACWLKSIILAIQKAEIERIAVKGQLGKKFLRLHLNQLKSWAWWGAPVIPARMMHK
jgi:hypothetical protein